MKRTNLETNSQMKADRRDEIATELQFACAYWLRTIQPHIAGRKLRGAEYYLAVHGHSLLKNAADKAANWNAGCRGKQSPLVLPNFEDSQFRPPEPIYADDVSAAALAGVTAQLLPKKPKLSRSEAIREAHDLIVTAEQYVANLPKRSASAAGDLASLMFSTVTFSEIQASNKEDSGKIPLLPNEREGKAGQGLKEQTLDAIRKAVKRHLDQSIEGISEKDYEADVIQESLILENGVGQLTKGRTGVAVSFQEYQAKQKSVNSYYFRNSCVLVGILAQMRFDRFKKGSRSRQDGAATRETKLKDAQ